MIKSLNEIHEPKYNNKQYKLQAPREYPHHRLKNLRSLTFTDSTSFGKFAPLDFFFPPNLYWQPVWFIKCHWQRPPWVYSFFISIQRSSIQSLHNANQVHMTASLMTVVIYQSVWLMPCLGWKQMSLQSPIYRRSDVWQTVLTWFTSLEADAELTRQLSETLCSR